MTLELTPSQTVGPFFAHRRCRGRTAACVVPDGTPGAIRIGGRVLDGAGEPVPDALVETWQADPDGRYDHPDDPRGADAGLPRLRPLRDRRRRRGRLLPSSPARCRARRPAAGAAPRRVGLRPRPARPRRHPHLLRRRGARPTRPTRCSRASPATAAATLLAAAERRRRLPLRHPPPGRAARPSSSTSERLVRRARSTASSRADACRRGLGDGAWLQAMLDAEAALARAQARAGADPRRRPPRRSRRRCDAERFDVAATRPRRRRRRQPGRAAGAGADRARSRPRRRRTCTAARPARTSSTPPRCSSPRARSTPLLRRPRRGRRRRRARWPASTATRRWPAARCCSRRVPTTFGLKAAGWLVGPRRGVGAARRRARDAPRGAARRRRRARSRRSATAAPSVLAASPPSSGWPSRCCPGTRSARARRARRRARRRGRAPSARSRATSCCWPRPRSARCAEGAPGRGGSSTMPHKRNPVAAISAVGVRRARPGSSRRCSARWRTSTSAPPALARRVAAAARAAAPDRLGRRVAARRASSGSRSTPGAMRANLELTGGRCSPSA